MESGLEDRNNMHTGLEIVDAELLSQWSPA